MILKTMDINELESVLYEAEIDASEQLRKDYSGRAMYGERCFGIVGSAADLVRFCVTVGRLHAEYEEHPQHCFAPTVVDGVEWLEGVRTDSMGHGAIYYWPGVAVSGEDEDGEED